MARKDRRQEIMLAVERLFASRGADEITLDDVIAEARIGKGTIYRYFHDKDDLFFQAATGWFEELAALLSREVPKDAAFDKQFAKACEHIAAFFQKRGRLFRMMQSQEVRTQCHKGDAHARWKEQRDRLIAVMTAIMERGIAEGVLRDDIPANVLARLLLGMLRTQAREASEAGQVMTRSKWVLDFFYDGARRRARPSAPGRKGNR